MFNHNEDSMVTHAVMAKLYVSLKDDEEARRAARLSAHRAFELQPLLRPPLKEESDRELLRRAFVLLRRVGWTARMNFSCCSTCGHYELSSEGRTQFVFFNRQANSSFNRHGDISNGLYLQWAHPEENAEAIVSVLVSVGLDAYWDGSSGSCVEIVS